MPFLKHGSFQKIINTAHYRLYALKGTQPTKPGLARAAQGAAIAVEVYDMPAESVGTFLAGIPAPLGLGAIELADGSWVNGFICEACALHDAEDITAWGGWRNYLEADIVATGKVATGKPKQKRA